MSNDPVITIADLRVLYCVRGVKAHLEGAGIDFPAFLKTGLPASQLYGHGFDPQIDRAVDLIRSRAGDGR